MAIKADTAKVCIICDKTTTNNANRVCALCQLDLDKVDKMIEGKFPKNIEVKGNSNNGGNGNGMTKFITKTERVCVRCEDKFMPTSNVQIFCPVCSDIQKKERHQQYWIDKKKNGGNGEVKKLSSETRHPEPSTRHQEQRTKHQAPGIKNADIFVCLLDAATLIDNQIRSYMKSKTIDTDVILDIRAQFINILRGFK